MALKAFLDKSILNKFPSEISGGMKKRVALARALYKNPKVIFLDEPTTGLDPNQLLEIRKLIRELGDKKIVLLSTHILQEVDAICDRVLIIKQGEIVLDEKLKNLRQNKKKSSKLVLITVLKLLLYLKSRM